MIDISHIRDTDITLIPDDVITCESISDPKMGPTFDSQDILEANTQLLLDPDDSDHSGTVKDILKALPYP